jgi:hypothetical protein
MARGGEDFPVTRGQQTEGDIDRRKSGADQQHRMARLDVTYGARLPWIPYPPRPRFSDALGPRRRRCAQGQNDAISGERTPVRKCDPRPATIGCHVLGAGVDVLNRLE